MSVAGSKKEKKKNIASKKAAPKEPSRKALLREIEKAAKARIKSRNYSFADISGMIPTVRDVDGTYYNTAFDVLAKAVVAKINQETGAIPKSATDFSWGRMKIYLYRCLVAYCVKNKTFVGEISDHPTYLNFVIPPFFATLLQESSCFVSVTKGRAIRMLDKDLDTHVRALNPNEGITGFEVWSSDGAEGEPVFSNGLALNYASLTLPFAEAISRRIKSAYRNAVFVRDVAEYTTSLTSLMDTGGNGIKPISTPVQMLTIMHSNVDLEPAKSMGYQAWGSSSLYWISLFEDLPYAIGRTINGLISHYGADPFKIRCRHYYINSATVSTIVCSFLKDAQIIGGGQAGATAWIYYWNYFTYIVTGLAAAQHWISRVGPSNTYPNVCYTNKAMRSLYTLPVFAQLGTQPLLLGNIYYTPEWIYKSPAFSLISALQSNSDVAASRSPTLFTGSSPFGDVATVTIGGFPPFSAATHYNVLPLRVLDSICSSSQMSTLDATLSRVDLKTPICPCDSYVKLSGDLWYVSQTMDNNFGIDWIYVDHITGDCVIDDLSCACSLAAGMFTSNAEDSVSAYYQSNGDTTGEGVQLITNASLRNNNFDQMSAAMQNKDVGRAMMSYFRSRVSQSFTSELSSITGKNLVELVNSFRGESMMPVEYVDNWTQMMEGNYPLPQLAMTIAAAAIKYGPRVLQYVRELRDIPVRVLHY